MQLERQFRRREREQRQSTKPYWIDIHPPSVDEYRPAIQSLLRARRIQSENSFLLQAETRSASVDAIGLGQLRGLNKDLGNILGIVDQARGIYFQWGFVSEWERFSCLA
jgi:hypothetical protein